MAYLGEHRFDLGELTGFPPPAAAALIWPEFCRLLPHLRDGATPWAGQIGAVRAWYQPHLNGFTTTQRHVLLISNSSNRSR